jgi:hypothetical protein
MRQAPTAGFGALRNLRPPVRQTRKSIAQAFQLRMLVAEHASVVRRAYRQLVRIGCPDRERASLRIKAQHELARLQDGSALVAK